VSASTHIPVLLDEVEKRLAPRPGGVWVDATLGLGGYARRIAERVGPTGTVVGIDRDEQALRIASAALADVTARFVPVHGNFRDLPGLLDAAGIGPIDGLVADLGVSSMQLDEPERGFSWRADAPLDLRMDRSRGETAAEILARIGERELARALRELADERWAARIARFVVERRATAPIRTTGELADLVSRAIPRSAWPPSIHPATRTFLGLRVLVNDEYDALRELIDAAASRLRSGGRLVIVSFHSGEDRIVKQAFRRLAGRCVCPRDLPECRCGAKRVLAPLNAKPIRAGEAEVAANPRARSALLRAAEKL
jgi:16S rRNA (cytosine1402-N4)-methyltransferase